MYYRDLEEQLIHVFDKLGGDVLLKVRVPVALKEDHPLVHFAKWISSLSTKVTWTLCPLHASLPSLEITSGNIGGIHYCSVPEGGEIKAFLRALKLIGSENIPFTMDDETGSLDTIQDVVLEVFVAPACPHCPAVMEEAQALALALQDLDVWMIDCSSHFELAKSRGVRSTPSLAIDGQLRWSGPIRRNEILELVMGSIKGEGWDETLRSQLESADLDGAVHTVLNHPEAAPLLAEYIQSPHMSHRILAVRILEEMASVPSFDCSRLEQALTFLMTHQDPSIRGDVAYALGLVGGPSAISTLSKARKDTNPDVKEIIEEALENLKDRLSRKLDPD